MSAHLLWAEVDLVAIAHNVRQLRRITRKTARLMVAVKADGYGHGAVAVSRTALANGAEALGVARLEEGLALRQAGIVCPILIFGYTPPECADSLLNHDLTQTLYDLQTAQNLSRASYSYNKGKRLKIHLKVDTGMGRLGLLSPAHAPNWPDARYTQATLPAIETMANLPGLELEGIFTHFASSDSGDKTYAQAQFERFSQLLDDIKRAGISIPVRHAANSGAIIDMPHTHLDMVRAGISLYGLYPSAEVTRDRIALLPAMSLKARVVHVKKVPAGFSVSYNSTWQSSTATMVATVPVGYADGYSRAFSNCGEMLVRGSRAKVVGRVCMDLTLLDVGHISDVKRGDEVVIFGAQKDQFLGVDDLAGRINTINYEIVSGLTARVPRVYI